MGNNRFSDEDLQQAAVNYGMVKGIGSAIQNYITVSKEMTNLENERTLFKLDKKTKELAIKKAELDPLTDPMHISNLKKQQDIDTKLKQIDLDKKELLLGNAKDGAGSQVRNVLAIAKQFKQEGVPLKGMKQGAEGGYEFDFGGLGELSPDKAADLFKNLNESQGVGDTTQTPFMGQLQTYLESAIPGGSPRTSIEYTPEQESVIQDNVKKYGRSREEIVAAMKKKGVL